LVWNITFLDTNIEVYANDSRDERKQMLALELISQHLVNRTGVISSQVFQEYASVALTTLKQPIAVVTHQLHLLESFRVVLIEPSVVRRPRLRGATSFCLGIRCVNPLAPE